MFKSINPYNGKVVFQNKKHTKSEIKETIEKAHSTFLEWRKASVNERSKKMKKLAQVLEKNKTHWAEIMTLEMGKPIAQSIAEIEKCAWVCEYYAENAEEFLKDKIIKTEAKKSYVSFEPLGVILGVMPWNYPFWQVFRFAVPTIMAGNTAILKHASNVMESSKAIEEAFKKAGFPEFCFSSMLISSGEVEEIIRNPKIKGVSLTGSKPAGSAVAKVAGEEIKPSLLELGGSNALVVFEDCDIEKTVEICINARFQNTGQSCIAGKRLLVHESISEEFIEKLTQKTIALKSGNPLDKDTYIGTLAREDLAEDLEIQLNKSVKLGAEIIIGGNRNKAYFEPTLVKNVTKKMPIFQEETFGPLLAILTFKTDEEAVELVNESEFGLGVSIFTKNQKRIEKLIPQFDDGAVFVNDLVKSHPHLPFGGTKISGYGRELSTEGIHAFVNKKTVFIK